MLAGLPSVPVARGCGAGWGSSGYCLRAESRAQEPQEWLTGDSVVVSNVLSVCRVLWMVDRVALCSVMTGA